MRSVQDATKQKFKKDKTGKKQPAKRPGVNTGLSPRERLEHIKQAAVSRSKRPEQH